MGWWLGIVVFALGIALLVFTFYSVFMLATNPNGFLQKQLGDVPVRAAAVLSVGLTFSPNPVNVDTQDARHDYDFGRCDALLRLD